MRIINNFFLFILKGQFKTNTVLQYEDNLNDVRSWGYPALSKRPNRLDENRREHIAELFKLHLGDLQPSIRDRYRLPVEYKKAITDYLREIGKVSVKRFNII